MIITPNKKNQNFQGFGTEGFGGFTSSREPTTEELLAAAIAQGGALGAAAEQFATPKKSFFSSLTDKSMGALDKFIATLQTGNYAVRGLLDPDLTVREAIQQRATPGELLVEDAGFGASKAEKFRTGAMRFAVDTLLDPLTYVTFGSVRGVLGLTRGAEAVAGVNLAKKINIEEGARVFLTPDGEEAAVKLIEAQRKGLQHTYLTNERVKMVNQGVETEEIAKRLKKLEDTTSDYVISQTLNAGIDMKQAAQTIANMAGNNSQLLAKWIDKGGIKFFGQTLLSGQRIRSVSAMLPGMTLVDRAVQPFRQSIGNMFNTKYQDGTRLPDGFIAEEQKWKDIMLSSGRELLRDGHRLKKELNLSSEEWEFISAAIEHGLKPRDPRASDVWNIVHGIEPTNGTVRDEVWRGMISVQQLNKKMKTNLQSAGVLRMKGHENYIQHMLVDTPIREVPIIPRVGAMKSDRSKFATISTLVDSSGNRIPVRMLDKPDAQGNVKVFRMVDGEPVEETVRFVDISSELPKIEAVYESNKKQLDKAIKEVNERINSGVASVKTGVATRLIENLTKQLDGIPDILPEDKNRLIDAVSKFVDDQDVDKVVKSRLSSFYKDGVKLSTGQSISKPDLDKLALDIVMAKDEATSVASRINKLLAAGPKLPHTRKSQPKMYAKADKELAELAKRMKDEAKKIRVSTIERKLDDRAIKDILTQAVAITSKNPKGLSTVLDSIISNKQLAYDLSSELGDISRAYQMEKDAVVRDAGKFVSETGESYKRVRAYITEARELGVDFEDNALVLALSESHRATKMAITKEFVENVGAKFGVAASKADSAYVPISRMGLKSEEIDLAKWLTDKNGEQLVFHPAVASRITDFAKAASGEQELGKMFRAYDSIQNYFKAAVTAIFPAFHGRNALSNVFLMYNKIGYEALNPANHVATANMINMQRRTTQLQKKLVKGTADIKEYSELMLTPVFTDRTGYRWTWGEMRDQLVKNVIAFHPKNVGMVDQMRFGYDNIGEAAVKMFPKDAKGKVLNAVRPFNPIDKDNMFFTGGYKTAGAIEDYSRTLTFLAQLKATGDPVQASRITKLALFDYANLTKFEKVAMRRIIPFYTFTRKNLELQVTTLLTNPGKLATQIRGVQTIGEALGEEGLTEEELMKLPEWAREGYRLVTGREGSNITLLKTIGTPIEETMMRTGAQENLSIISPLIKAPFEWMGDYSFFHGRQISEVTKADAYQNMPEPLKKFIGYEAVQYIDRDGNPQVFHTSFNPQNMYLMSNLPVGGRLISEIARFERQETSTRKGLALAFGIDTQEYDLDVEAEKIERKNRQELEKLLQQAGIGYTFSRYVPE